MKRAIVLSGGGSKGSYQLGVWKALRKLHIQYEIVTGTSIGALNGALMVQNSYFKAHLIWNKLNLEYLFDQKPKENTKLEILKLYGHNFITNNGMNNDKIERIIKRAINNRRFYQSPINYGLITFNVTTKKPFILKKKDIKKEQLVDYLMASATCYPAIQMKEIDGQKYIDGGIYDNLPMNLAIDMGAEELIVVDLKAPGIKQKKKTNISTTIITPRNNISFFLNFNQKQARENRNFGYNDTMKTFGKLEGNLFTFYNTEIPRLYQSYKNKLQKRLNEEITLNKFLQTLEELGRMFQLKEDKIYTTSLFLKQLQKKVANQQEITKEIKKQITSLNIKKMTSTKVVTLYFLSNLEKHHKKEPTLTTLFPKDYQRAIYLYTLGVTYGK